VSSGYTTVNPAHHTVLGVEEFFAPPFAARGLRLSVNLQADSVLQVIDNGDQGHNSRLAKFLLYADGIWSPHKITRFGTYHYLHKGKLVSLGVTSDLIPLYGQAGFVEKIVIRNRASESVSLKILPELNPGQPAEIPLSAWEYDAPRSNTASPRQLSERRWQNEAANIGLYCERENAVLEPGESITTRVTVLLNRKTDRLPEQVDAAALEQASVEAWQTRLATYTQNIPTLESDIAGLDDYYRRAVISGLVCLWENPEFALNPHLATSGMDGGSMCTYLWDNAGYAPNMVSMMLGNHVRKMAKTMADIDLGRYYAFAPDGSGVGVKYSYSTWAFTRLVDAVFKFIEPDRELYDECKRLVLNDEKRKGDNNLIDYGHHGNLLEMRSSGWEHYVISPNAERSWCLNRLAEMGEWTDAASDERKDWQQQADGVITAIRKELWDEQKQWFVAAYPDGFRDAVRSIQVYFALRTGVCTPAMEKVLISEMRDRAFLGNYGLSTVSKTDSTHYDVVDTDWAGGGSYAGNMPLIALIMFETGHPALGWDILQRLFWMGQHFTYYPQEHLCDRPMTHDRARANIISGLCGAEAILFGLMGFEPQYNGDLYAQPRLTADGTVRIKGFVFRGNTYDMEASSKRMKVWRNGQTVYSGKVQRVKISG
jgi:hypothetical protein